jgi:hypothetical protein
LQATLPLRCALPAKPRSDALLRSVGRIGVDCGELLGTHFGVDTEDIPVRHLSAVAVCSVDGVELNADCRGSDAWGRLPSVSGEAASIKKTAAHHKKVLKADAAAMVAGMVPAYVRRDEPDHPENWVLYSPVLDPEADRDEAA